MEKEQNENVFWEYQTTVLVQAVVFYLRESAPPEQRNLQGVIKLLEMAEISQKAGEDITILDRMFGMLKKKNPDSMAAAFYDEWKQFTT